MISRKTAENKIETPSMGDVAKPFVDVNLEIRVLRLLIFDNDFDNASFVDEINSNIAHVIFMGLSKDAFTSDFKQWIFEKIVEKFISFSECISKSFLYDELKSKYKTQIEIFEQKKIILDKIFSHKFELKTFKPLVEKLKEKFLYRSILDLNLEVNKKLQRDYLDDKQQAVAIAQEVQDSVAKLIISTNQFKVIEEDIFQDIDRDVQLIKAKKENPNDFKGIPSGYEKLDKATGGWHPGEFILVLGRPEQGKSILLLNFAYNAYLLNYNIVYVTIEMPLSQQRNRFLSLSTKTAYQKIKLPHLMSDEEIVVIENKMKKMKSEHKNYLWFIDAPQNCNTQFIDSRITALENVTGKKIDLLILDPIYLMAPSNTKVEDTVGTISWDVKLLARARNIPAIAASQFNRESHKRHLGGKEVDSMDAAFTDKLGYNTDMMIGVTGDKESACLYFPKARDSQLTKMYFIKNFDIMKFEYDNRVDEEDTTIEKDKD
jgi:replicative DNA helicase